MIKYYLSKENLEKIIKDSLDKGYFQFPIEMKDEVNSEEVVNWVEEMGYKAEIVRFDSKPYIDVDLF